MASKLVANVINQYKFLEQFKHKVLDLGAKDTQIIFLSLESCCIDSDLNCSILDV